MRGLNLKDKKAQITIFVIIGVALIVTIALIFLLTRDISPPPSPDDIVNPEEQPEESIEQCVELAAQETADLLIKKGGYITKGFFNVTFAYPKGYYRQGIYENVPYMCYTSRYRTRCIPQEPVLMQHLKDEMMIYLEDKIEECFDEFENEVERKGYDISIDNDYDWDLNLVPGKIKVDIEREVIITKSGDKRTFDEFNSVATSKLYNFASITQEIVSEEARYCNSNYINMMKYNTWAKITKHVTQDNIRIYTIEDANTQQDFMFAVRGCVLPIPS